VDDARGGRTVAREDVRHLDPERRRDPLERRDADVRPAALDLAQEALAQARPLGHLAERLAPKLPDRAQAIPDVDGAVRDADALGHQPVKVV
jgi:hypothetical protein